MAVMKGGFVTILFVLSLKIVLSDEKVRTGHVITVSTNGNDSSSCLLNRFTPCRTVAFVLQYGQLNDTSVQVKGGTYIINNTIIVANVKNLTISGENTSVEKTKFRCRRLNSTGLFFHNCQAINLLNFSLDSCGFEFKSSSFVKKGEAAFAYTSLLVKNSVNFSLESVNITNSSGIGAVFYDVVGTVTFNFINVDNCIGREEPIDPLWKKRTTFYTGGGIYIEFRPKSVKQPSKYIFKHCIFTGNLADDFKNDVISQSTKNNYFSLGRGGGISFISRGYAQMNQILIDSCLFSRNRALWGAGMFIEINDESKNNSVKINNSTFNENNAFFGGGGLRIGINSISGYNKIDMEDVKFYNNTAKLGGGFSQYRVSSKGRDEDNVFLKNCAFENNSALAASDIHLQHLSITLNNVNASGNSKGKHEHHKPQGSLYCYSSHILLKGTCHVSSAVNTGYLLDYCLLTIRGTAIFTRNKGENGGALALYGHSKIRLTSGSSLLLHHNEASSKGGAMYVEAPVPLTESFNSTQLNIYKCFFLFGDEEDDFKHADQINTTIDFLGNKAPPRGGDNIWATTIKWCRGDDEPGYNNTALKWKIIKSNGTSISTNHTVVTSPQFIMVKPEEWNAYPGLPLNATVLFHDENWNQVNGTVLVILADNSVAKLKISDYFSENGFVKMTIHGNPKSSYSIELKTTDRYSVSKTISQRHLLHCPPGYRHNGKTRICDCQTINKGVTNCDYQNNKVYIIPSRWGNVNSRQEFAELVCPKHYCRPCTPTGIGCPFKEKWQCETSRDPTSKLCSKCKEGYSVLLGSEKCEKFTSNKGIWFLLLFATILVLIVLIFMIANVNTYMTSLNALLYSYQVIPMLVARDEDIDLFISFVMAILNVSGSGRIQKGFRIWAGMTNMQKLALNYLCPLCLIAFSAGVAKVLSKMRRLNGNRKFASRAFVFISVIAYSDFTKLTFKILHWVKIGDHYVAYYAGNMSYFGQHHAPYACLALFFLVVAVIGFPLLVLFPSLITSHGRFVKLKGIFDAFSDPFKTEPHSCHHFAAFYFINRLVLLIIFIALKNGPVKDVCFSITCVSILIVFILYQPYKDAERNFFDALQLTNIVFMSIMFTAVSVAYEDYIRKGLVTTIHAFCYVPLICFMYNPICWAWKKTLHYKNIRARGKLFL